MTTAVLPVYATGLVPKTVQKKYTPVQEHLLLYTIFMEIQQNSLRKVTENLRKFCAKTTNFTNFHQTPPPHCATVTYFLPFVRVPRTYASSGNTTGHPDAARAQFGVSQPSLAAARKFTVKGIPFQELHLPGRAAAAKPVRRKSRRPPVRPFPFAHTGPQGVSASPLNGDSWDWPPCPLSAHPPGFGRRRRERGNSPAIPAPWRTAAKASDNPPSPEK